MIRSFSIDYRVVVLVMFVVGCSSDSGLRPFKSDGCSLFPDSSLINEDDWCSCCFEHDMAYWRGGSREAREDADLKLKECIIEKTGDTTLATVMYEGVRFGGSPYFYNWYRWGYGWSYDRKYQPLTQEEAQKADELLEEYFATANQDICR